MEATFQSELRALRNEEMEIMVPLISMGQEA